MHKGTKYPGIIRQKLTFTFTNPTYKQLGEELSALAIGANLPSLIRHPPIYGLGLGAAFVPHGIDNLCVAFDYTEKLQCAFEESMTTDRWVSEGVEIKQELFDDLSKTSPCGVRVYYCGYYTPVSFDVEMKHFVIEPGITKTFNLLNAEFRVSTIDILPKPKAMCKTTPIQQVVLSRPKDKKRSSARL